jgi:hypothetical protein
MADDAARLADAEAGMAELQEQLRLQESAAAAAAVRVSPGAETGGGGDDDLVAELEDRLLEAEQVREGVGGRTVRGVEKLCVSRSCACGRVPLESVPSYPVAIIQLQIFALGQ